MPGRSHFIPITQVADRLGCNIPAVRRLAEDPINLKLSEIAGEIGVWADDLYEVVERIRIGDSDRGERVNRCEIESSIFSLRMHRAELLKKLSETPRDRAILRQLLGELIQDVDRRLLEAFL